MIGWIKRVHKKRDFTVFWFYNQPVYTLHSSNTRKQTLTILTAYTQTVANLELPADILPERVQFAPTIQSCTVTYHMETDERESYYRENVYSLWMRKGINIIYNWLSNVNVRNQEFDSLNTIWLNKETSQTVYGRNRKAM